MSWNKPLKKKKCRNCLETFEPYTSLSVCCSIKCSLKYNKDKEAAKLEKLKAIPCTVGEVNERFQKIKEEVVKENVFGYLRDAVQALARKIDYGQDCSSCDKKGNSYTAHGGHLISRGRNLTTAYHLFVIWIQCDQCNTHKGGNEGAYWDKLEGVFGESFTREIKSLPLKYPYLGLKTDQAKIALKIARQILREMPTGKKYSTEERIELRRTINKRLNIYQ